MRLAIVLSLGLLFLAIAGCDDQEPPASPVPTATVSQQVPLPTEEDAIRLLFALINEHRASEAVAMLAPSLIANENMKQAWGVQFNAFESAKVKSVSPSNQAAWTDQHTFAVTLEVRMKPESASAAIPYYGWSAGENVRFVSVIKVGALWRISAIGTGP